MNPNNGFKPSPRHFALTLSLLLLGVLPLPRALNAARQSARSLELNRADREAGAGGYYEGLIDGAESTKGTRSELSLRLMGKPVEWARFQAANVSRPIVHDFLQFDLWPNLSQELFGHKFTTNRHGMRDRDYTVAKPDNTFRIVLLGSSIDMGWGVADDDTYENLLEDWLNSHAKLRGINRRFEVLNFAVAAYAPTQRYATLSRRAAAFSPDMVIYSATMLDVRLLELHLSNLLLRRVDLTYPFVRQEIQASNITEEDIRLDKDRQFVHRDDAKAKIRVRFWPIMDSVLGALAADCRSMDIPLVMIAIPRAGKADAIGARETAMAHLAGIAAHHATPMFDLTDSFDAYDSSKVEVAAWDDHPNAFGHRRIFLGLAKGLTENSDLYRTMFGTESTGAVTLP